MPFVDKGSSALRVPSRIGGAPNRRPVFMEESLGDRDPPPNTDDRLDAPIDPLEAAIAEGRERGYREGFEQGKAEGLLAGREEGAREGRQNAEREASAALDSQLARVRSLCGVLIQPFTTLRHTLAEAVVDGSQRLAKRMVAEALNVNNQALVQTVSEILGEVTAMEGGRHRLEIRVAPDALDVTRSVVAEALGIEPKDLEDREGAAVVADPHLSAGDVQAVLVPPSGDTVHRIEWDARLEQRWNNIRTQLGLTTR